MRTIIFALIALLFFTQPALARTNHPIIPQQQTVVTDNDLVESGTYTNVDGKKYIDRLTPNQVRPLQMQLQSAEITHTVSALTTEELVLGMVALQPG